MCLRLILSITLFVVVTFSTLAQTNIFQSLDSTFLSFVNSMDQDIDKFVEQMDEDFYKYLGEDWQPYPVSNEMDRDAFYSAPDITNISFTNRQVSVPEYGHLSLIKYLPQHFSFFGEQTSIRINNATPIKLKSTSETDVSEVWKMLGESNHRMTFCDIQDVQKQLLLNDWGILEIVKSLSERVFTEQQVNERIIYTTFLMTHLGYDVKFARSVNFEKRLVLLVSFSTPVFGRKYSIIDKKRYFIYNWQKGISSKEVQPFNNIYSYQKNLKLAQSNLSLFLEKTPSMGRIVSREYSIPNEVQLHKLRWREGLVQFYESYPSTSLDVYLNTPLSSLLHESLLAALSPLVVENDDLQTVKNLLLWFYDTFPYQDDRTQQYYFAEQTMTHMYSDCEDRSILFARIVRLFTDLEIILLAFHNHVATGISFDQKTDGYSKTYKNKQYTIVDPSSAQKDVGYIMPEYGNREVKIIELKR